MKVFPRARRGYVLSLALCALLLVALALPAAAARPAGKGKPAKADKASTSQVTEDNDTNDGDTPNNVVDDGDNRHPSGKDKSVEKGNSGNQGKSTSDPDDDGRGPDRSNGGADKPDGPGGVDLADQDGNNGCGNDDDFEDDNEGWCGGKPKPERQAADEAPKPVESCTDGSDAAECDADNPACTPGAVGCDDEDTCSAEVPECSAGGEEDTCSADVPECIGGGSDTDTDVDLVGSPDLAGGDGTDTDVDLVGSPDVAEGDGTDGEAALGSEGQVEDETDVAGVMVERPSASPAARLLGGAGALASGADRVAAAAADAVLAATGLPTLILGLLALAGIGAGTGLVRRNRKR